MANSSMIPCPSASQEPAERQRQLFEEAPIAYHEIDTTGVIREVNRAECRLLGYLPDELLGHGVWEFVAPECAQIVRDAIANKAARLQPLAVVTREYRCWDGRYVWLEIHENLIENSRGEVVGIRSALLDITERRHLEAEIRKQRDWMAFALRSATQGIITADALGNITMMNPAAEVLAGWRQADAIGRALEEVCRVQHDSGEPVDLLLFIVAEPVVLDRDKFVIVDRCGTSLSVRWSISPICNDDAVIVGATLVIEKT